MPCKRLVLNSNLKAILGYLNRFEQPAKAPVDQKVKSAIHLLNNRSQLNGDLFDTNNDTDYEIDPVHLFMPGRFPQKYRAR